MKYIKASLFCIFFAKRFLGLGGNFYDHLDHVAAPKLWTELPNYYPGFQSLRQ